VHWDGKGQAKVGKNETNGLGIGFDGFLLQQTHNGYQIRPGNPLL
jgi:hypothetical protein